MKIGFTGTRHLKTDEQRAVIDVALQHVGYGTEFVTGSCVGVDAYAGLTLVKMYPRARHRVIVPANRKYVDYWWHPIDKWLEQGIDLIVDLMPVGTSFRERDQEIVNASDELVAFASHPEDHGASRRSGTWLTVRLGRAAGIKIHPPFVFDDLCTSGQNGGKVPPMTDATVERTTT